MAVCKKKPSPCTRKRPIALCAIFRHKQGDNPRGRIRGVMKLGRKRGLFMGLMAMQGKKFCVKAAGCFMKSKRKKCKK